MYVPVSTINSNNGTTGWRWGTLRRNTHSVRYVGGLRTTSSSPTSYAIRDTGFSLRSFVPTIWELIPYSFLVDYFSNLGDLVTSTAVFRNDFVYVVSTDWRELHDVACNIRRSLHNNNTGIIDHGESISLGHWEHRVVSMQRFNVGSLTPSFRFECPLLGSKKWLNIAALLRTARSLQPL